MALIWDPILVALRLIFLGGHLETLIFKDHMLCHSKLYVRYIDDGFAVFDDVNPCLSFLNILNSQHDNRKFTIEKSTNTLQFFDVDSKINQNTVDAWVCRKQTNTGFLFNDCQLKTIGFRVLTINLGHLHS